MINLFKPKKIYDVDYFINKFSRIKEHKWTSGSFRGWGLGKCANGHCGINSMNFFYGNEEAIALNKLFLVLPISSTIAGKPLSDRSYTYFWSKSAYINDGVVTEYQQSSPKLRILAALHDIKKQLEESPQNQVIDREFKKIIRYVSVPESIKEQSKELILQ